MWNFVFGPNRLPLALVVVACVGLGPSVAFAGVFGPPGHVLVRNVKPSSDAQHFELGLTFEIAPIKAVAKKAVDGVVDENPELAAVSDVLADVDLERVRNADADELRAELGSLPGITEEQKKAIDENISPENKDKVLQLAEILQDPEDSIAFSIRPKATLNFSAVRLRTEVPLAGFELAGEFEFVMGNANLDMNFGHTFGSSGVGLGVSYGLHTYFPTGTERADMLGYTNVLNAPVYLHEYLTPAPYVGVGVDLLMARVSAHGEIVPMFGVRGDPEVEKAVFFRYGAGVLVDLLLATLHGEIVGTTSIENAEAFEGSYAITGITFGGSLVHVGICAQLRLADSAGVGGGSVQSVDMDTNFIATLGMGL